MNRYRLAATALGLLAVLLIAACGSETSGSADRIGSVDDVTVDATSADGVIVGFSAPDAVDATGNAVGVICEPGAGTAFPLGVTTVTCRTTPVGREPAMTSFAITVVNVLVPASTPEPTATPKPTATPEPTATPTAVPTATPEPTATPTAVPTATPNPLTLVTGCPAQGQSAGFPTFPARLLGTVMVDGAPAVNGTKVFGLLRHSDPADLFDQIGVEDPNCYTAVFDVIGGSYSMNLSWPDNDSRWFPASFFVQLPGQAGGWPAKGDVTLTASNYIHVLSGTIAINLSLTMP